MPSSNGIFSKNGPFIWTTDASTGCDLMCAYVPIFSYCIKEFSDLTG